MKAILRLRSVQVLRRRLVQALRLAKKYWYILVILVAVGGIVWWIRRPQIPPYQEYTVTQQPLTVSFSATGSVKASRQADLNFQTPGRVGWVGVSEGDQVSRWQALASLDRRQLQLNLRKELNDYMKVRWDFDGAREAQGVTTDNLDKYTLTPAARRVLEKAQFDLNNAVLDVQIQSVANEYATIVAPFAGVVATPPAVYPGQNALAATPVISVIDPNSLYFETLVDELDISQVRIGQRVTVRLDSYPDDQFSTIVSDIGFVPQALSGGGTGYAIKMQLPGVVSLGRYKLGMNGDVEFIISEIGNTLVLPTEAVKFDNGVAKVNIVTAGRLEEKEIQTGSETDEFIEIIGGLAPGDQVVVPKSR